MDQRICTKFCYKNGIKYNKVLEMLRTSFGESTMSKTRVHEWCKCFQDGHEGIEADECSGHPSTLRKDENVKNVEKMSMQDPRIRKSSDDVGISNGSCHKIFPSVLDMKHVAAKFVLKVLNFEQRKWVNGCFSGISE